MISWERRPVEVANLFNPAFCGEIIRICIKAYSNERNSPFPYFLSFLILPILLYEDNRSSIDARSYQFMHVWLQSNPQLRVGFSVRVTELMPITQECLAFLLQINALSLNEEGTLTAERYRQSRVDSQREDPIFDFYRKARTLGKWFARAGDATAIYIMWGIQP